MFSRFTRFTHLRTAPKFKYTQKLVKLFRVFVRIQCMQTFFLCIIIVSIILIKICIDFDAFSWNFHQAEHSRKNWEVLKSLFSEFLKRSENFSWILREFWSNSDVERSEWFGRSAIESFNASFRVDRRVALDELADEVPDTVEYDLPATPCQNFPALDGAFLAVLRPVSESLLHSSKLQKN